ncbi:damage-control phosphatase ARMT1-like [Odontomachus brunneus]|uniref:damage-control phosphatase ARMT1-like n=1 Tax=Odontomachus brunneus TaxID=486640 RepID=UPI0013F2B118|nr:damage-control phosphatase ARMT1-like [Odontomachus brunneus]XP_032676123.1 damage-control phosphatase ARMT1-like [Odontomachus brunneus]XP_032676124.1 damage-control phosphatase ARMT1-like [Odontomachus brunneus]
MTHSRSTSDTHDVQNISTPVGLQLSGKYKKSFAYVTIKDRLPVILTRVIDHFSRNKEAIKNIYGEDSIDEIKYLIGFVSKLKNELVTNKTLKPLRLHDYTSNDEADEWNIYLEHRIDIEGEIPTWFNTIWLYCECYMYRVLAQEISLTVKLSRYDPFEDEKQANFIESISSISALGSYVRHVVSTYMIDDTEKKETFRKLLNVCLWGNRCDLSLSAGSGASQSGDPLEILESLKENIISNDWENVWNVLHDTTETECVTVDIVLDNAGYELFTDLCLAAFLILKQFATKVRFYVKKYPWYVSDATLHDFYWILEQMGYLNSHPDLQFLSKMYFDFLDAECWSLEEEPYWTSPYDFTKMKEKDTKLYEKLSSAKLVIFKGDLNYRKLLGDVNYEHITTFANALGDFCPTNIVSLRTVKSDVCVGLQPGLSELLFEMDDSWMVTGKYGLIQASILMDKSNTSSELSTYSEENVKTL